jgi:hypothetical protein
VRDEIKAMQIEETRRVMFDTQYFKDKVDKLKADLNEMKKMYKEAAQYKELYEDLKTREDERHAQYIKEKTLEELKRL